MWRVALDNGRKEVVDAAMRNLLLVYKQAAGVGTLGGEAAAFSAPEACVRCACCAGARGAQGCGDIGWL